MKIVFVIDSWNDGNGSVVATRRVVEALIKRGHEITLVSTDKHEGNFEFHEVPGFYPPGLRESLEKMNFKFARGKKKILRKAFEGADIVQVQLPFFIARNAIKIANRMGIPVTGAAHVQPQNVIAATGKDSKFMEKMLHAFFNFTMFKRADVIHCPSHFAADLYRDHGSKAHMEVISNGIPEEYQPVKHKRPDWWGKKFAILNIGRHAMEKRQELLIEGVAKSKYKDDIQLLLCGKGENSEKLKKMGEQLPVKPLIEYVSQEDKMTYLNTADIFLHASIVELESLACLEAIGCGLPCLIGNSPFSAAPQFALDERFLFETDDADDMAKKIDYLYENRKELKKMKREVLKMAEFYRFERSIERLENYYDDIIVFHENDKKIPVHEIQQSRKDGTAAARTRA